MILKGILIGAVFGLIAAVLLEAIGVSGATLPWFGALLGGLFSWRHPITADPALLTQFEALTQRLERVESALGVAALNAAPTSSPTMTEPATDDAKDAPTVTAPEPAPAARWIEAEDTVPPPPTSPGPLARGWALASDWLSGGNTIVRVGIVILFVGIGLLVKYAAEHSLLPVELRLAATALLGSALLALGWRLRTRRPGYALSLQGGGVGILYLTTFGALRVFEILTPTPAFALLALLAGFSAVLAVAQNSLALAVLGTAGGFLAPLLASSGGGSHVALFGYYAVLNGGVLLVAGFRAWRVLNVLGFVFTFVIGAAWGVLHYGPQHYASTQPFLLLFFAMYLAIGWLVARRRAAFALRDYVDGTLTFGVPITAFSLQYALVREIPFGPAFSALGFGALYLMLAAWLWRGRRAELRLLTESWLALGIGFLTLAVPLALSGGWIAVTWALEGAALLWIGIRQQRWTSWLAGIALQGLAGIAFLTRLPAGADAEAWLHAGFIGAALLAVAGLFSARYSRQGLPAGPSGGVGTWFARWPWSGGLLVWGAGWWYAAGLGELARIVPESELQTHAQLGFIAVSALGFSSLASALRWPALALAALPLALTLILGAGLYIETITHPGAGFGWLAWPVALGAHYLLLWRHARELAPLPGWLVGLPHALGVVVGVGLAAWEIGWRMRALVPESQAWWWAAIVIAPLVTLWFLHTRGERVLPWPIGSHPLAYRLGAGLPLAVALLIWLLIANWRSDGNAAPLPAIPLLNPLDLASLLALAVLARFGYALGRNPIAGFTPPRASVPALLGAAGFYWANAALLRTLHQFADIPYRWHALWNSLLVQMAFSLFWTTLALTTMVLAVRLRQRTLWFAGAALMALTVLKLLLLDLSSQSGMTRIASFIGVGLLMLAVGYFAPLPPAKSTPTPETS
ncbi:MAG: DUF2339 domain-containing protein [Thiotrichales bacterium]